MIVQGNDPASVVSRGRISPVERIKIHYRVKYDSVENIKFSTMRMDISLTQKVTYIHTRAHTHTHIFSEGDCLTHTKIAMCMIWEISKRRQVSATI